MQFFPLFVLALLNLGATCLQDNKSLPTEFEGVWTIVMVTENGIEQPLAKGPDGSVSAGECDDAEMIIYKNRIVIVKTGGASIAGKVKVLATEPEVKIQVTTGRCHDKSGDPAYAILRRNGGNLVLAWGPPEMRKIDREKGGGQILVTAKR